MFLVYSIALFLIPMLIITFLYTSIGLTLRRQSLLDSAHAGLAVSLSRTAAAAAAGTKTTAADRHQSSRITDPTMPQHQKQLSSAALVVLVAPPNDVGCKQRRLKMAAASSASVFNSCRQAVLKVLG